MSEAEYIAEMNRMAAESVAWAVEYRGWYRRMCIVPVAMAVGDIVGANVSGHPIFLFALPIPFVMFWTAWKLGEEVWLRWMKLRQGTLDARDKALREYRERHG